MLLFEIIEEYMPAVWKPGMTFMQMLLFIQIVLLEIGLMRSLFLLLTGPHSSNLDPIGHVWAKLKERIYTLYLDLESFDGIKEPLKEQCYKAIEEG